MIRVKNTRTTKKPDFYVRGFALPTILISSIVMLIVLLVSVSSTTAVRTAMKNQYYTQLAQAAGEAGVAYAQACLNANQGIPQWSDAAPLKSNTNCSGVETVTCPTTSVNALCSVSRNGNVRSNFSVGLPELDADGRAIKLPNTGYVEVLRTSNSAVWRKYNQKSAPMVAVPDLCSGKTKSILGWSNAVAASFPYAHPEASAQAISNSTGFSNLGPIYFRKDFSVAQAGTYTLSHAGDGTEAFVDGRMVSSVPYPTVGNADVYLDVGCHFIQVKATNKTYVANTSGFRLSLKLAGAATPLIVSDKSWRVSTGESKHFSEIDFYADPDAWTAARDIQSAEAGAPGFGATADSASARWINTTHSYDGSGNYPSNAFTLFRDNRDVYVSSNTNVKITLACDWACYPYVDGQLVHTGISYPTVSTFTVSLASGYHKFGFMGYNDSGASGFAFAAVTEGGTVLSTSDASWSAANLWTAANPTSTSYSYDNSYVPTLDRGNVNVLVVAGGGSGGGSTGGGGGGGGVIEATQTLEVASYPVVVGAGGAIPGNQATGRSGANSSFNLLVAIGGGGGGYSSSTFNTSGPGLSGGSGGGGQTYLLPKSSGSGTLAQGNSGGPLGYVSGSGGGGAGASGTIGQASYYGGTGGAGRASSITGSVQYYGGGGGGGGNTGGAGGIGGGGTGASGALGTNGTPNTGGGGGAGWGYAAGNGGAGGSGVVIIAYPSDTLDASGGTITNVGGYTIHTFLTSGTFAVTSIN